LVTNLPPQAAAQYKKVLGSRTSEEKLQNLKLYLSMVPRHKGTEKLQRQIRRQISELEDEIVQRRRRRTKARRVGHLFGKSKDSPLVALVGRTQSGKSTLLAMLTSAQPHISDLPFATQIRIERALQHSCLGIGVYEAMRPTGSSSTAPFCFPTPSWPALWFSRRCSVRST